MVLRAPLVRLLLHVIEPAPRLFPVDLLLELCALQLELQAQLVFLVCTQVILLELPGLELGGPFGDELGGGAFGERSLALLIMKLKLRGGGGIRAAPLHQLLVVFLCRKHPRCFLQNFSPGGIFQVAEV